jgi:hypothetical protein
LVLGFNSKLTTQNVDVKLFIMTRLAEFQLVIVAGDKIVARLAAVGIMAGDAGELPAPSPWRGIGMPCYRMTFALTDGSYMNPFAN